MLVFTEQWIGKIRTCHGSKPRQLRPFGYFIATEPECQPMRDEIEKWVAELPPASQAKAIKNLKNLEQCRHTYHELVLRSLLKPRGLPLDDYEREWRVGGKPQTPDWSSSALVIDVFTKNVSDGEDNENKQQDDLQLKLREIKIDVELLIKLTTRSNFFVPRRNYSNVDQWRNDYSAWNDWIVDAVRSWLEGGDSRVGSKFSNNGLEFEVILRGRSFSKINFISFSEFCFVNPVHLRRTSKEKVDHYRDLAMQNNIPLVVAVIADIQTGYDREEFENVLFGHIVHDVAEDKAKGSWQVQGVRRERDSLFNEEPTLSAAIWVSKRDGVWTMNGYENPSACRRLTPELVKAICTEVNLREMLPKGLIAPSWLATYERNIDAIWGQLVTLNSSIFALEKIFSFPFGVFVIRRGHFWDLAEEALVEMCVMIIWRVAVDCKKEGLTLQQLKNGIRNNLQQDQYKVGFDELVKTSCLAQKVSRIGPKIGEIRHNYIAHFNLAQHVAPTPEQVKGRTLVLSELKEFRDTLNSYFELLCFGHQKAVLPREYELPSSDVEKLLDGVARQSDWLKLPEDDPELWALHKPEQPETDLQILNQYRTKFGLPPA